MLDALVDVLRRPDSGVRAWRVQAAERRTLKLGVKDGDAGGPHTPISIDESASARYLFVWDDGRVSRGTLERRRLAEPGRAVRDARAAAYDDPDAAWVVDPAPLPEVALHDPAVAAVADGATAPLASRLGLAREAVARSGAATWSASYSASIGRGRVVTSTGLDASVEGTSTGWYVNLDGEIGDGHSARDLEPDDDVAARLERLVDLRRRLRTPAERPPEGELPVLLHPRVADDFALDTLLHGLEGSVVANGEGVFARDAFGSGAPALREDLALAIDPLAPMRRGSYRCTSEGVPAARTALIEGGRLLTPVLDTKYARRLGLPPTAQPVASDTVTLSAAEAVDLDAAYERAGDGALVLSVLGVHTQDKTSGDFSLATPQALEIRGGRLGGRMRGTIAGNLFRLLRDPATTLVRFPGEHVPGLLVRCRLSPRA